MRINIGINGFGRIGRLVFRAAINNKHINGEILKLINLKVIKAKIFENKKKIKE